MRAARPRVHGGMGGWPLRGEEWGAVAELLGMVDDFAAVRGLAGALPLRWWASWRRAVAVAVARRHGWQRSLCGMDGAEPLPWSEQRGGMAYAHRLGRHGNTAT